MTIPSVLFVLPSALQVSLFMITTMVVGLATPCSCCNVLLMWGPPCLSYNLPQERTTPKKDQALEGSRITSLDGTATMTEKVLGVEAVIGGKRGDGMFDTTTAVGLGEMLFSLNCQGGNENMDSNHRPPDLCWELNGAWNWRDMSFEQGASKAFFIQLRDCLCLPDVLLSFTSSAPDCAPCRDGRIGSVLCLTWPKVTLCKT